MSILLWIFHANISKTELITVVYKSLLCKYKERQLKIKVAWYQSIVTLKIIIGKLLIYKFPNYQ